MDTPVLVLAGLAERADGALSPGGVTFQYPPCAMILTHLVYTVPRITGEVPFSSWSCLDGPPCAAKSLSLDQRNELKPIDGLQGTVGLTGCG